MALHARLKTDIVTASRHKTSPAPMQHARHRVLAASQQRTVMTMQPRSISSSSAARRSAVVMAASSAAGSAGSAGGGGGAAPSQTGALAALCGVLSAVSAVKAASGALAPGALVSMVAGPAAAADPVLCALMGAAVSVSWLAAAYLQALKDAATHARLGSDTYQRLAAALAATAALAAATAARYHALVGAPLAGTALVSAGLIGALMSRLRAAGGAGGGASGGASPLADLGAVAAGALGGVKACMTTKPANLYSAFYALQALTCAAAVAVLWPTELTPLFPEGLGLVGRYLTRACAVGLVLVGTTAYTLKDAADRGRLGASTFRLLALAQAAAAAQTTWFFYTLAAAGVALNQGLWLGILAQGVACVLVCDVAFFTSKKKAA